MLYLLNFLLNIITDCLRNCLFNYYSLLSSGVGPSYHSYFHIFNTLKHPVFGSYIPVFGGFLGMQDLKSTFLIPNELFSNTLSRSDPELNSLSSLQNFVFSVGAVTEISPHREVWVCCELYHHVPEEPQSMLGLDMPAFRAARFGCPLPVHTSR